MRKRTQLLDIFCRASTEQGLKAMVLPLSPLLRFLAHKLGLKLKHSEHLFAKLVLDAAQ